MKSHVRAAVIGGGIMGTAMLYQLVRHGWRDVALIEKGELTAGSTWHAAGQVPHFSDTAFMARVQYESFESYKRLDAAGYPTGVRATGSLRLARSADQIDEFKRFLAMARGIGIKGAVVGPNEVKSLWPLLELDGVVGGLHTFDDGYTDPAQTTNAFANAARAEGAEVYRHTRVVGLARLPSGEFRIETDKGTLTAGVVINAAGFWASEISEMLGHYLPVLAIEHEYLVTEPIPELANATGHLPVLRDLNIPMYARQERGGLLVSCYETHAIHFGLDGVPKDFGQELLPPDIERAAPSLERIAQMIPAFSRAGIKQVINGPTSRAADLKPCVGPAHGLPNYFTLCGVVGGFLQSSLAKGLAEWIVEGEPSVDLAPVDVRRFGPHATKSYAAACTATGHAYSNPVYYPHGISTRGRPARVSALYGTLKAKGAVFGAEGGWETPLWFRRNGAAPDDGTKFERQLWVGEAAAEARAMTEGAALLDLSSRAKFEVSGTGAAAWLAALTKDRVPAADGAVADAAVLTAKSRVAAVVAIERMGAQRFYVTAPGANEGHVRHALVCKAPADSAVADRTAADGLLWLGGAKAAEVLAKAARGRAPEAGAARTLDIGIARARIRRVDDVTAPAYEIVAPMEQLLAIYEALQAAGAATDAGLRAYDTLRIRAGRPAWGIDIAHDTFAAEAGLGTAGAAKTRLVRLSVEAGKVDPWGGEIVLAKDADVGVVTSAAPWGAGSVAIARVDAAHAKPGQRLALEILGARRDAVIDAVL